MGEGREEGGSWWSRVDSVDGSRVRLSSSHKRTLETTMAGESTTAASDGQLPALHSPMPPLPPPLIPLLSY